MYRNITSSPAGDTVSALMFGHVTTLALAIWGVKNSLFTANAGLFAINASQNLCNESGVKL